MGKGRTLITSRSERYLGSLNSNHHGQETSNGAAELGEGEVWSVFDNTENGDDHSANGGWSSRASMESNGSFGVYRSLRPPPPSDLHRHLGGLSLAFDDSSNSSSSPRRILQQLRGQDDGVGESPRGRHMAASAPVNVPDWSKIHRVDSAESLHELEDGLNDYDPGVLVPPHEYLAQYSQSRKIAANSVFEGVGRTLKGRDLSRVRDAVWSQTRFDG